MSLTKELLHMLDNTDEPLPKRLKIAENAFKCTKLPVQRREIVLLRWIGEQVKKNEMTARDLLRNWLTSPQMQNINRSDVTQEDLQNLMDVILQMNDTDDASITAHAVSLIENRTFQMFYKYNLESYCKFVCGILDKISDSDQIYGLLVNEELFNRNLIMGDSFYKCFIRNCLECFAELMRKFPSNDKLFLQLSKITEKCLFHRNFKTFWAYFKQLFNNTNLDENPPFLPKFLLRSLRTFCDTQSQLRNIYKLIFHSYCHSYGNNSEMIYKFFALVVETLGFNASEYLQISKIKKLQNTTITIERSIDILVGICEVLSKNINKNSLEIHGVTFSEFIQNLVISVTSLTDQPNCDSYEFLKYVVSFDPVIVERIINDVLVYVMLSNKEKTAVQYREFLITVFEVFNKLHRIPILISKLIRTLKLALEGTFESTPINLQFLGARDEIKRKPVVEDLLPVELLDHFTLYVTTFAGWQIMNLFGTFLFHLEEAICNDLDSPRGDTTDVYIEVISKLTCQFLSSIRIAEHTVPVLVTEKFMKSMKKLEEILRRFGFVLVDMKHNPVLMRAYMNLCYTWGELYMTLAYYSINSEVTLAKMLDSDSSACNVTYLHSYLDRDRWCLISQRITNFGEKACKNIMNKLYLQKLKAMLLFEKTIGDEIVSSITASVLSDVDENWRDLIFDRVVLTEIIPRTDCARIAQLFLQNLLETKNLHQLSLFYDSRKFMAAMLYACLSKLSRVFKRKRKSGQSSVRKSLTCTVFGCTSENLFVDPNSDDIEPIRRAFVEQVTQSASNKNEENCGGNINEEYVANCLEIIKAIPTAQWNNSYVQEVLIYFLIGVLIDLRCHNLKGINLIDECESLVIGLSQSYTGSFRTLIQPFSTTKILINNFTRYLNIFTSIALNVLKPKSDYTDLSEGIEFLANNMEHEKYLQCSIIILKFLDKYKKSKISPENKQLLTDYQNEMYFAILELLKRNKKGNPDLIEAYAMCLRYNLLKDSSEIVTELLSYLDNYLQTVHEKQNNVKGALLLFITVLRNRPKLSTVKEDAITKAWDYCQGLSVDEKMYEEYTKLVILIIEHVPNESFSSISTDLLENIRKVTNKNDLKIFLNELKVWAAILSCSLNPVKTQIWQRTLESLLLNVTMECLKSNERMYEGKLHNEVIKFEINIIQRVQLPLTSSLIDGIIITISVIMQNETENFADVFTMCVSLLQTLLKFRKSQMMDYLPSFLQRYRLLLKSLCIKSNSDLKLETNEIQRISDCAHKLEKLTYSLVACNKHLMRISPYLIADILKEYEKITLLPNVKMHLNNCLYSLMSLCDEHAVSYLMRVLSTASTEMFKITYENYKKYYKFTGKV